MFEQYLGSSLQFTSTRFERCAPCMQAAQELGMQLTPVKETLIDMAVTLIQLGIAKPRPKAV